MACAIEQALEDARMLAKKGLIKLDKRFLGGTLLRAFHAITLERTLNNDIDYRFIVHYQKGKGTLLAELCDKYGSDKGQVSTTGHPYKWAAHTYTDFYSRLFDHCRFSVQRVFECGLGTNNPDFPGSMLSNGQPGASLRAWRDYFPNSEIFGADIDRGVLFDEDRIRTYYVDQLDPEAIASMWSSIGVANFDLVVDDGLHTFDGGRCLFEHSFDKVRPGGLYVIEDVAMPDMHRFRRYFIGQGVEADYINLLRPENGLRDNSLIAIRR
jgi:SAM-dependent methyltransferase